MPNITVIDTITSMYNQFTKSDKIIADYIFANQMDAQYLSINELAEICKVGEATVSRFCKKLGFDGYNYFKLALAKVNDSSPENPRLIDGKITANDTITEMSHKICNTIISSLEQTINFLDEDAITQAVNLLTCSKRVYCFGNGGSSITAMDTWARFLTVSPKFHYIQDSHLQSVAASTMDEDDTILFFSYSGATRDMRDTLKPAKERCANIILITHFTKSPAAEFADIILLCGSKKGPDEFESVPVKMSFSFITAILYQEFCRRNPQSTGYLKELTARSTTGKMI